jgi:serine O-acetyltransferase
MSPIQALKADTHRVAGNFSWAALARQALICRNFRLVVTMRLCQAVYANTTLRPFLPLFIVLHKLTSSIAAVDFPWKTHVGAGFALTHGWGAVVSHGARIGSNVTMFHGATLGRRDRIGPDGTRSIGFPTVEDEVWIGPHAVIVGGVTIGRGSRIAANAFVTEDVPPYSVVSNGAAAVVRTGCVPDVMNPALDSPAPAHGQPVPASWNFPSSVATASQSSVEAMTSVDGLLLVCKQSVVRP